MATTLRSIAKPEASRYMFAMFDILGFSRWMRTAGLQTVLNSYHLLIEKVVVPTSAKGGLGAIQTPDGAIFAVTGPPGYAYFSDTILMWHPLVPAFVDDFISRCGDLVCEALAMDIPLRGALTLGDAVLSTDSEFYLGEPIIEAANLEKAQNWIGLTFGKTAVWSAFLAQMHGTSIIEYEPPTKEHLRDLASPIVLDWPRKWRDKFGHCPTAKLHELDTDPHFSAYWENTIAFAEYSLAKHDWHLRPEEIPQEAILRLVSRIDAKL